MKNEHIVSGNQLMLSPWTGKNQLKCMHYAILAFFSLLIFSCVGIPSNSAAASAIDSGPRTLILDGKRISADDVKGFISWYCVDYVNGGGILLEVGYFGDERFNELGFILFDGGYTGKITTYRREGLEHRWDWESGDYSFVIQPDGTGLYFDFSSVKPGQSAKPRAIYRAYKR